MKTNLMVGALGLIIWSCSSDDSTPPKDSVIDELPTVSELQDETLNLLTKEGDPKIWKISSATLTNGTETFDISNNFNVSDDEIIFSGQKESSSLEWRKGHDINLTAENLQETLLDYYKSPVSSSFSFDGESSSNLTSDNFEIQISDDKKVKITINGSKTAKNKNIAGKDYDVQASFVLEPKGPSDYIKAPDDLTFTEAFTVETASVETHSPGMIGSNSDNSFFFVTREEGYYFDNPDNPQQIRPERVVKFDLDDMSQSEFINYEEEDQDLVSKQLHIINNQLISIGGSKISAYNFDLSDPVTVNYTEGLISQEFGTDITFTRSGMAVQDDAAYIIGGGATWVEGQSKYGIEETKNIYKWDLNNKTLTFFAELPEPRYGARGTIVNDKMYVIGGSTEFSASFEGPSSSTIYIIDMNNPDDIQTLNLGAELQHSFVQKFENLIIITGKEVLDVIEDQPVRDLVTYENTRIWAFDTEDNSLTEISHNLSNPDGGNAVHQMAIFNGKMFVLYGNFDESLASEGPLYWPMQEWTIYMADLE